VYKPRVKKTDTATQPAKQPRKSKTVTVTATATATTADASAETGDAVEDDSRVRSFKVQLPGNEQFIGRFTGLTPYQAANKALSKYFRDRKTTGGEFTLTEITFSIRESTRNSKRSTYVYNGLREKLANPVKYTIKGLDGVEREIVKEYKNKLVKVKKVVEAKPTVAESTPAPASATA
jgi:hypothetical protein